MIFDVLNVFTLGFLGDLGDALAESDKRKIHDDYLRCRQAGMSESEIDDFLRSKWSSKLQDF